MAAVMEALHRDEGLAATQSQQNAAPGLVDAPAGAAEQEAYEEAEQLPQCFILIDEMQSCGVSATDIKVRARVLSLLPLPLPSRARPPSAAQRLFFRQRAESQGGGVRHRQVRHHGPEEVPHRDQRHVRRES
jgi:hypothetical protein|tara:strand:+ start:317 stop:712 length:396 start_codon:yes stop_codon:yes gene_type:complete|eukprot:30978-Pelagococcus_subviridis.AAC.2